MPFASAYIQNMSQLAFVFVQRLSYTALLFTWTDLKTILFPVTVFACAAAPVQSITKLVHAMFWIWIHLLLCNVSNQVGGETEDKANRPWRPIPAGRISKANATLLRWCLVALCLTWSARYGSDVVSATVSLTVTTVLYDELGMAAHPIGKNLCCIFGYASFETGATKLIGPSTELDSVAWSAILITGLLIFTTIQAQDFADVQGDIAIRRVTLPILAPELSRIITMFSIVSWSAVLGWYWGVGICIGSSFLVFGSYVGARYYRKRSPIDDDRSYFIFNLWLVIANSLPLNKRTGILSF